jgi:hypothetical protein
MSEFSFTVVRLDALSDRQIQHIAATITTRLLQLRVITLNGRFNELWQPSAWMVGPEFSSVVVDVPWTDSVHATANSGVDIATAREAYHPVGNDEEPRCRACRAPAPAIYTETYGEWVQAWLDDSAEPVFTCGACGWAAPIGDWEGEFSLAVGAPAITFHNWPDLTPDFLSELRQLLGGRTAVVRTHL